MSSRRWSPATGGIVGPSEARSGSDRLRFLLEIGAEKARQERLVKERAVPVPTNVHQGGSPIPSEKAKNVVREMFDRELRGGAGQRIRLPRVPVTTRHTSPFLDLEVKFPEKKDAFVHLDGSFWEEEIQPAVSSSYRTFFRLLAMTYLNNTVFRDRDEDFRIEYKKTDVSGDHLETVIALVFDEMKTEQSWKDMFDRLVDIAPMINESIVDDQTVLRFSFWRDPLDVWLVSNLKRMHGQAERSAER